MVIYILDAYKLLSRLVFWREKLVVCKLCGTVVRECIIVLIISISVILNPKRALHLRLLQPWVQLLIHRNYRSMIKCLSFLIIWFHTLLILYK